MTRNKRRRGEEGERALGGGGDRWGVRQVEEVREDGSDGEEVDGRRGRGRREDEDRGGRGDGRRGGERSGGGGDGTNGGRRGGGGRGGRRRHLRKLRRPKEFWS